MSLRVETLATYLLLALALACLWVGQRDVNARPPRVTEPQRK
jgi:hypothetical protein